MEYFYYLIIISFILPMKKQKGLGRLLHWGPLIALSIIASITTCAVFTHYRWFPPTSWLPLSNMAALIVWLNAILYNFYRASTVGPGYVPNAWKPAAGVEEVFVQYCLECSSYKCPRSHHCSKCRRCVMKMDHHCPWINNCVGHFNHKHFTTFLFLVPLAVCHALSCITPCLYHALYRNFYMHYGSGNDVIIHMTSCQLILCFLAMGMSVGVVLAVGVLFLMQMRSILKNESGIESWIMDKADYRKDTLSRDTIIFPYNIGRWRSLRMVFAWSCDLDGITWPVREGCHQYTLTIEQMQQKSSKRSQSIIFSIKKAYSGSWLPLSFGYRTVCDTPCIDEYRLRVKEGDKVVVTRYKKHWLYGEKLQAAGDGALSYLGKAQRGWFARACACRTHELLPLPLHKLPPCHQDVDVTQLHKVADEMFLGGQKKLK